MTMTMTMTMMRSSVGLWSVVDRPAAAPVGPRWKKSVSVKGGGGGGSCCCCCCCFSNSNSSDRCEKVGSSSSCRSSIIMSSSMLNNNNSCPRRRRRRRRMETIVCEVALGSNNSAGTMTSEEEEEELQKKIGARIKVTAPVKVYHVAKLGEEVDLCGMEGAIKQYAGLWKGKRISANLPFKVEFVVDSVPAGGKPVKFFAHLKEDEFQFL